MTLGEFNVNRKRAPHFTAPRARDVNTGPNESADAPRASRCVASAVERMRDADSPRARDSANVTTSETTPARAPKRAHPTAGWLELERALRVVYGGVVRELAPLGVVGMATFDPMAGFVLWSEQREAERDRTRTMRELYPNETMKPESPGEGELASLRVAVKYAIGAYGTASSVLSDASFRDKLKSLKANERGR